MRRTNTIVEEAEVELVWLSLLTLARVVTLSGEVWESQTETVGGECGPTPLNRKGYNLGKRSHSHRLDEIMQDGVEF